MNTIIASIIIALPLWYIVMELRDMKSTLIAELNYGAVPLKIK